MKKLISIMCSVCMILSLFGVVSVSAEGAAEALIEPWCNTFNADDWSGDTQQFDGNNFVCVTGTSKVATVTSVKAYDLTGGFSITSYLIMKNSYTNYYGEYCAMGAGNIELRIANISGQDAYEAQVVCGGTVLARYSLSNKPNNSYRLLFDGSNISVFINDEKIELTLESGETADSVEAAGADVSCANLMLRIANNYGNYRYFEGFVLRPITAEYTPNDIYLTLNDNGNMKNGAYFSAPNTVKIYTGDRIRFSYQPATVFNWADDTSSTLWNITSRNGYNYWAYSKQSNNSKPDNYFKFDIPGTYTFHPTEKVDVDLITIEVIDSFYAQPRQDIVIENDDLLYPESGRLPETNIPTGDDAVQIYPNAEGIFFSSDIWVSVPLVSKEIKELGYEGGESCQAVASLVCDPVTGQLCFFGTDCGGVERSLDGGAHWSQATIGLNAGGATGIMIDGKNIDHVIAVGCDTSYRTGNGIYITTNATEQCEWQRTLAVPNIGTHNDYRIQVAIDETSYSEQLGYSTVIYWSRENLTDKDYDGTENDRNHPALYKSTDGGYTWQEITAVSVSYDGGKTYTDYSDSSMFGGANIAVNQTNGWLFVQTSDGIFLSKDGGSTFTEMLTRSYDSVPVCMTLTRAEGYEGYVYVTTCDGLYVSDDYGSTWTLLLGNHYPTEYPRSISVSPVNPDNIYITNTSGNFGGFYSNDGGKNWAKSVRDYTGKWEPVTGSRPFGYWSPVYANTIYTMYNGVAKSIDGGKTFYYSNNGINNICPGGQFNANVNNTDLIAIASQDYNGGFSTDGGETWTYLSWEGKSWGGFTYGAYMLDDQTIIVCNSASWTGARYLWITHDAGKTYENTGILVTGTTVGIGALGNDSIAFMGEWRTADSGYTWQRMSASAVTGSVGCDAVFCVDYNSGRLFGSCEGRIVTSTDNGLTWKQICIAGAQITDIDYNPVTGEIFVSSGGKLFSSHIDWNRTDNELTALDIGASYVSQVAVDYSSPNVMYVSCFSNSYYYIDGFLRSLDYGRTWTCLTRKIGDGRDNCPDYGRQVGNILVNPNTGNVLAASGCRGLCKISAPPAWYSKTVAAPDVTANSWDSTDITYPVSDAAIAEIDTYQYFNTYAAEDVNTVYLDYNSSNNVENNYFSVPDGTVIRTGDQIKLNFHSVHTPITYPDGTSAKMYNVSLYKNNWTYARQADLDHSGYFSVSIPGEYSLYCMNTGVKLCTFTVVNRSGYAHYISDSSQLAAIADKPDGVYILTEDITFNEWNTVCGEENPFTGVLYGDGHSINGLTSPLFGVNSGTVSRLMLNDVQITSASSGAVCKVNNGLVEYCRVTGSISGDTSGGIAGTNNSAINDCLVTAAVTGSDSGAICGTNSVVSEDEYADVTNCVYNSDNASAGCGSTDTGVNATGLTTAELNSGNSALMSEQWYCAADAIPSVKTADLIPVRRIVSSSNAIVNGYMHISSRSLSVSTALYSVRNPEYITVTDENGIEITDHTSILSTGAKLKLSQYSTVYDEVTVVLNGDISGTGYITSADYLMLKMSILGTGSLSDIQSAAGDANADGSVNSADLLMLKQHMLGINRLIH